MWGDVDTPCPQSASEWRQRSEQLRGSGMGLRVWSRALGYRANVEERGGVPGGRQDPPRIWGTLGFRMDRDFGGSSRRR